MVAWASSSHPVQTRSPPSELPSLPSSWNAFIDVPSRRLRRHTLMKYWMRTRLWVPCSMNNPLLSLHSTHCQCSGTSQPWTRFSIRPLTQFRRRAVYSPVPRKFRFKVAKLTKFMGIKYADSLKRSSLFFTVRQILNPQYHFESTTALAWLQLLVSIPPSALILGHEGYGFCTAAAACRNISSSGPITWGLCLMY